MRFLCIFRVPKDSRRPVDQSNSILLFKNLLLASDMITCSIIEDQLRLQPKRFVWRWRAQSRLSSFIFVSLHHNIDQSFEQVSSKTKKHNYRPNKSFLREWCNCITYLLIYVWDQKTVFRCSRFYFVGSLHSYIKDDVHKSKLVWSPLVGFWGLANTI